MAARAREEIQHERLASHAKVSKGEEALREEASRRRELEEEVARLRRELEALRPVAQSYSALQEQMRNVEDDSSRLRQELDAGKHLSSVFTGVCFTLTCVTDGHVDSLI
jgi:chromosome segregation ATPase